jgi:hypothetical protein
MTGWLPYETAEELMRKLFRKPVRPAPQRRTGQRGMTDWARLRQA